MDEDGDRVGLLRTSSREQAQSFVVSDEVTHIEERARRMGNLEVYIVDTHSDTLFS